MSHEIKTFFIVINSFLYNYINFIWCDKMKNKSQKKDFLKPNKGFKGLIFNGHKKSKGPIRLAF